MPTYTAVITNDGRNLFANAAAGGGQVIPVRVNTGDGSLGSTDPTGLSNLIHPVQSYAINSSNALVPYQSTFQFQIDSTTVTTTYQLREIGLIAKLSTGGPETLIYYSSTAGTPDTITPSTGDSAVIDFNTLTISFSNTPNTVATLTAVVPPPLHAITHLHRTDGSSPDPIPTASSADYGLCPRTPNDSSTVLIGGATASFGPVPHHAPTHTGAGNDPLPLSTTSASGALRALSGDGTTVLQGTGNWGSARLPGEIIDYAGNAAPAGWLLCDGTHYPRVRTYATLYAALGGAASPWGQGNGSTTFNVPDLRGRVTLGGGSGPGLTPRGLGAAGGEENHTLSPAEMPYHNHGVNDPGHSHSIYDPTHAHGVADGGHAHSVYDGTHAHSIADPTHHHYVRTQSQIGGTTAPGKYLGNPGYYVTQLNPGVFDGTCVHNEIWSDYSATGIGIYASGANIAIYAKATGIGIYGTYTGVATYAAATGVTTQYAGGNAPHNTLPPYAVLNKLIKY